MNPISKAINDIKATIPKEVLDIAYNNKYDNLENIESKLERVIRNRVLVDTNLVHGVTMYVPMHKVKIIDRDEYGGVVIEIPEKLLDNRSILSVHSLVTSNSGVGGSVPAINGSQSCDSSGNSLMQESLKIKNNLSNHNIEVTSNLELIGERTIMIGEQIVNLEMTTMKIVVENQRLLNNLPPRAYINFSVLATRAVKADIYNKLIVGIDQGYIHSGHQLGVIQSIIEKYEDMNELYLEYLTTTWTSVSFMSDNVEMSAYITSLFPNN